MAVHGRHSKVLPSELNKVCPEREDSSSVHPMKMSDFEVVPNLQQSSSSISRSRRKAHFPSGNNEKASSAAAGRGGSWPRGRRALLGYPGTHQWGNLKLGVDVNKRSLEFWG